MKVAAVLPIYPPGLPVGSFLATHELLTALVERGHDVTVYRRLRDGVPHLHERVLVRAGTDDELVSDAIAHADIVISHCGDDGFAAPAAAAHGVANVRLLHSAQPASALDGCALAVFNSHSLAAEVGWDGPQIVVHPPRRLGTQAAPGDLITLINFTHEKGAELFMRLARKRPDLEFLGVKGGWGWQLTDLPIRIPSNMEIVEPTPTIADVYRRTRILLMPSERETWGLVGVEAMACGIPVVANPTPGLRESLGDAGIFANRDLEYEWLDEIDRLQDAAEWDAASAAATARAVELSSDDGRDRFAMTVEQVALVSGGLAA